MRRCSQWEREQFISLFMQHTDYRGEPSGYEGAGSYCGERSPQRSAYCIWGQPMAESRSFGVRDRSTLAGFLLNSTIASSIGMTQ